MIHRREFITLLGGVAAAWPLAARAQQPEVPVIGALYSSGDPTPSPAFLKGLSEAGYVDGRNVTIMNRAAPYDKMPALVAEFVRRPVLVIVAFGNVAALAAKAATTTLPIVFLGGIDPVRSGLVASINRPGGNVTGVSLLVEELTAKRLEILRELVPQAATVALLLNPSNPRSEADKTEIEAVARRIGQHIITVNASTVSEIDAAFAAIARERADALLVGGDAVFGAHSKQLASLAARYRIPAIHAARGTVAVGGLMSYGDDRRESERQTGLYVGRILKGTKPADLPILRPVKFDFVINLKTAKALGIEFPPSFHLRATEVIE